MRTIEAKRWMRGVDAKVLAADLNTSVKNAGQLRRGIDVVTDLGSDSIPGMAQGPLYVTPKSKKKTPKDSEVENEQ